MLRTVPQVASQNSVESIKPAERLRKVSSSVLDIKYDVIYDADGGRMSRYALSLPQQLKKEAEEWAARQGVSLNQFIAAAVAEKIGTIRTAREFLQERAGKARPQDMLKFLKRVPKVAPMPGDER